jgi:hypothetical protein
VPGPQNKYEQCRPIWGTRNQAQGTRFKEPDSRSLIQGTGPKEPGSKTGHETIMSIDEAVVKQTPAIERS